MCHFYCTWVYVRVMSETVGIRELRHNTADIISAAEAGQAFRVTNRGKDTGVVIAKESLTPPAERRQGATLEQIKKAGLYTPPKSAHYEESLLSMVERGRDAAGHIGDRRR